MAEVTFKPVALKAINAEGEQTTLEFNKDGILNFEQNDRYTSYYLLKNEKDYKPRCTERLNHIFNGSLLIVREVKGSDGVTYLEEIVDKEIISRTPVEE